MDGALGPPDKMRERRDKLTPMMQQYYELSTTYDDALLLFQVGDFYEAFCEAAETVARRCEVTLTSREDSTGTYAMAGLPIENAESYVEQLLEAGYRVAIADQVEEPAATTGVVDRAVTRIVTPGTLTESELLDGASNSFVAAVAGPGSAPAPETNTDTHANTSTDTNTDTDTNTNTGTGAGSAGADHGRAGGTADTVGLAVLDVSTGEFYATGGDADTIADELVRLDPDEAVVGPTAPAIVPEDCVVSPFEASAFETVSACERLAAYVGDPELAGTAERRAAGALLAYAEYARGGEDGRLEYITQLTRYNPREHLLLDAAAIESLELFAPRAVHGRAGATLVEVIDETATAPGRRRLEEWLRRPLLDPDAIAARHDAVAELRESVRVREQLRDHLRAVYDIERLVSRLARGRGNARDLRSLGTTLGVVPALRSVLADTTSETLQSVRARLDPIAEVRSLIDAAIVTDPPREITEGGLIDPEYDDQLAALRATEQSGKAWIDDLQAHERERTGIDSLKVGHNSVHGYYIEVTDANRDRVPDRYERRQTLKNAERYYTPALQDREGEIIRAEQRADELEYELFCEIRSRAAAAADRVQALADALADLDALVSFATVAAEQDYCRPTIGTDGIRIEAGRHPVVERTESSFVPNDTTLDDDRRLAVITGPNMSGKSTYMRQVALIVVLAQAGGFVPAARARIEPVDRIFTRVGASDDIAGGRSTFMIEMTELATILEHATDRSLVVLDEVGRGTSTADGFAIARAVTEHLHDTVEARTLFATHHHDLTAVAAELDHAVRLRFRTRQEDEIVFEHAVEPGAATASYGVEVAAIAGVDDTVVDRARSLLAAETARADGRGDPASAAVLRQRLASVDIASMTPLEAMNTLAELKQQLDDPE